MLMLPGIDRNLSMARNLPVLDVQPVILCGGSGTRLWPLSRAGFPKQFLCLTGEESLFQQTARRMALLDGDGMAARPIMLVAGEEHRFFALEQLREADLVPGSVLLEPQARGTAAAVTLAALAAQDGGDDPVLVITPADHDIADNGPFAASLRQAIRAAAGGGIVILGVVPDKPETGFGYIQAEASGDASILGVRRFVEKPDAATAQSYLKAGGYFWNAGIFVFRASVWLQALGHFRPDILDATREAWHRRGTRGDLAGPFLRPDKQMFQAIPSDSVDFAVLEKCPGSAFPIHMVPLAAGWSDLGAWDAVWQALPKDAAGNAHAGDVIATDTRNTLVHASARLVSLVGVENLVVVETADAVLISGMSRNQDVKAIVGALSGAGRDEHLQHRKVFRPWGWYDSVDEGERFKVKRIQVKPGGHLSLQRHKHRAEHWVVVKGVADITCGDKVVRLGENQSTFIPQGEVHRLHNPGKIPLEIIEVQSGSYLGEDDIERLEDHYGRSAEKD
jgi:mannose-1-phosphate guanylyltransferase / mannose-6-phosphate isomerase